MQVKEFGNKSLVIFKGKSACARAQKWLKWYDPSDDESFTIYKFLPSKGWKEEKCIIVFG
ncbi:MAG: hypothetical protein DRP85_00640 [Candidatus Makaraimicrobium thalassicum]|nr:MAG: hypothetical protein DRP85_00640 [Candidatus Omnitrophota bacterium]